MCMPLDCMFPFFSECGVPKNCDGYNMLGSSANLAWDFTSNLTLIPLQVGSGGIVRDPKVHQEVPFFLSKPLLLI